MSLPAFRIRRTEALRLGRVEASSARYFVTWCTKNRARELATTARRRTLTENILTLDATGEAGLLAACVMPDHVHWLFTLGTRLSIGQVVGRVKAAVRRAHPELCWQINFFEHRLRRQESAESYAFYIFMNPYCARLCTIDERWPGWIASPNVRWEFEAVLRGGGLPNAEWIEQSNREARTLSAGAD